jgi:hypothetical protein
MGLHDFEFQISRLVWSGAWRIHIQFTCPLPWDGFPLWNAFIVSIIPAREMVERKEMD